MPQSHLHIKARPIRATKDNFFFKIEENVDISWQLQGLRGSLFGQYLVYVLRFSFFFFCENRNLHTLFMLWKIACLLRPGTRPTDVFCEGVLLPDFCEGVWHTCNYKSVQNCTKSWYSLFPNKWNTKWGLNDLPQPVPCSLSPMQSAGR